MAEPKYVVVANPTAAEIFADGAFSVSVRRNVARISLFSERIGPGGDGKTIDRVEVGRVVMPLQGFVALHARIHNVVEQMRQAGVAGFGAPAKANEGVGAAGSAAPAKKTEAPAKKSKAKKR